MALTKLGIIGAGRVGTAVAVSAAAFGVARTIALYDVDAGRAEAESADLRHGTPFLPPAAVLGGGDPSVLDGSDVLVFAAGAGQRRDQSRLDLAEVNGELSATVLPALLERSPDCIVIVVSNPVDVLTAVAQEVSSLPVGRVLGSGTLLDTSRLRVLLAERLEVAVRQVHVNIAGEHGDSGFALWSSASVAGTPLSRWLAREGYDGDLPDRLLGEVRTAAARIIDGKGATSTAIGLATARIVGAIAADEHSVLPLSWRHDVPGAGSVCLSLPVVVGRNGVLRPAPVQLDAAEQRALTVSGCTLRAARQRLRPLPVPA